MIEVLLSVFLFTGIIVAFTVVVIIGLVLGFIIGKFYTMENIRNLDYLDDRILYNDLNNYDSDYNGYGRIK